MDAEDTRSWESRRKAKLKQAVISVWAQVVIVILEVIRIAMLHIWNKLKHQATRNLDHME